MCLLLNPQGSYLMAAVGNQHTEVSTPFMHIRQFLFMHPSVPGHKQLTMVNSIMFLVSFFFGRFVFQLRLAYEFFKSLGHQYTTRVRPPAAALKLM